MASGSLPISPTTAVSHFQVYATPSPGGNTGDGTNTQVFQVTDNGGTLHILFGSGLLANDSSDNVEYSPPGTLYESHWTGSAWSTATDTGGRLFSWQEALAAVATTDGGYDVYYGGTGTDVWKIHSVGGSFGTPAQIWTAVLGVQATYCMCWLGVIPNASPDLFLLVPMTSVFTNGGNGGNVGLYVYGPNVRSPLQRKKPRRGAGAKFVRWCLPRQKLDGPKRSRNL